MGAVIDFVMGSIPWMIFFGCYAAVGGLVFAQTRLYLLRHTKLDKAEAVWAGVGAGAFFWITVPWFLLARLAGSVDAETRAEKMHAAKMAELKRETSEAQAQADAQRARLVEDIATRQRARIAGEEIPYTMEERLELEQRESEIAYQRQQLEQNRRYRNY